MSLRDFWMQVYIAAIGIGHPNPEQAANDAVTAWKRSWEQIGPRS